MRRNYGKRNSPKLLGVTLQGAALLREAGALGSMEDLEDTGKLPDFFLVSIRNSHSVGLSGLSSSFFRPH